MRHRGKAKGPWGGEIPASIGRIIAEGEAKKPQRRAGPEPTPGRAAVESAPLGPSEPAALGAPAEPAEPDELGTTPAASVVQETGDPAAELAAPDVAVNMRRPAGDDAPVPDKHARAD